MYRSASSSRVADMRVALLAAASVLALFATVAIPATAQESLSFSNYTLESGSPLAVGAVYRFHDVTAGVDALVTIDALRGGATLTQIDDASPSAANLSPVLDGVPANNPNPQADLLIAFVIADTSTPVVLDELDVTSADIDGDGTEARREFAIMSAFEFYVIEGNPPSELTVTTVPQGTQFTAPLADYGGVSTDTTWVAVTARFVSVSQVAIGIGQTGTATVTGTRVSSIHFIPDVIPFSEPDTTVATLAAELTSVEVLADGGAGDVVLRWTAASEENFSGYEVEARRDGAFSPIGFVEAAGGSAPRSYSFRAQHLAPGTWAFRLRMIDVGGSTAYSSVVEVVVGSWSDGALGAVYPNPTTGRATGTVTLERADHVDLAVYDVIGRRVLRVAAGVFDAGTHVIDFDAGSLPPGLYLYRLQTTRGVEARTVVVAQ
jgi:hypothetical protein